MILRWFQVAPIITGITFVFTFHVSCISIARSSFIYHHHRPVYLCADSEAQGPITEAA
jgi:hypothetical protein